MKDNAIQGLAHANTKNRLANDAEIAKRNKENVGRRNNYNSGLSAVSTSSLSPFFNTQRLSSTNSIATGSTAKDQDAKRMLQQKRLNQALKVAEKIPALNKYAKAAQMAQTLQNKAKSKGGFFKNMFGGVGFGSKNDEQSSENSETNSTYETEKENKGVFSVTIPQSTLKKVGIGIAVGGFITLIFFCIILLSAITDSAGQSDLASKDNPTEEEYENQYQTNEENESNNSDAEDSNNSSSNETGYLDNLSTVEFVNDSKRYNSKDLSDYFGVRQACTNDGSESDCRNGNEYKFYLKMYDIYYLYRNKYNVKLDLPLIMATLYYNNEQLPTVFKENLNKYDRKALKDKKQITNLDWEYDYKKDPCYTYLNANDFSYDMQILAKNMVTKKITYKCSDGTSNEALDIEISNYSNETLKCNSGSYDKDSVSATYELDRKKYDKFLLEYIKLKYHTKGTDKKSCSSTTNNTVSKTGKEAIDKMNEIALKEEGNGGSKYRKWYYGYDNGVDWCAVFVSWLFNQVDGIDNYIVKAAGAGDIPRYSVSAGYGTWYEDECTDPKTVPQAGDVILFDPWINGRYVSYPNHSNDQYYSNHVGYVYKVDNNYVYTVEGNSGNKVSVNKYSRKECAMGDVQGINGYFRPNY